MNKELLIVNTTSAGALAACLSQVEMGLAILVLLTALYVNVRNIIRGDKRDK